MHRYVEQRINVSLLSLSDQFLEKKKERKAMGQGHKHGSGRTQVLQGSRQASCYIPAPTLHVAVGTELAGQLLLPGEPWRS